MPQKDLDPYQDSKRKIRRLDVNGESTRRCIHILATVHDNFVDDTSAGASALDNQSISNPLF